MKLHRGRASPEARLPRRGVERAQKTGGRQRGRENLSIWEKIQLVRAFKTQLEMCARSSHRRNWRFWSALQGRALWSCQ